ncbi:hypothetical protein M430DRAFT_36900 [Amorphotheca resinae ATCC 22711]|uniref:Uncharacterized protein n=1 Tax=Amorphotheca resinae ATCC 22711 TaxID=857342 RepID=A0A2T3AT21_AMORE|nr:hypothetical protein M430DRAFT_36900 [Amorphotheca resinae ATCC 22711]PSS10635.1 hypothetical protein M430DRAFT_36900 [Amorphotheca resinae ATCC 22711]
MILLSWPPLPGALSLSLSLSLSLHYSSAVQLYAPLETTGRVKPGAVQLVRSEMPVVGKGGQGRIGDAQGGGAAAGQP